MEITNMFNNDLFNIHNIDYKSQPWKNLLIDEKIKLVKDYFINNFDIKFDKKNIINNNSKIDIKTINIILKNIKSGKLKLKKEISYDRINKKIICIKALIYDNVINKFVYKPDILNKKKNISKIAKSILYRKR